MMRFRLGLTARIGIIIIAVVVVLVGVVVYFVYQKTTPTSEKIFSVKIGINPVILEKGTTVTVPVELKTSNTTDSISFSVVSSVEVSATLTNTSINPSGSTSLSITGKTKTDTGNITVRATQGSQTAEASATVKVIVTSTNTNTSTNQNVNSQTNTNTNTNANSNSNTNTSSGLLTANNTDFKFSFSYPATWGDTAKATLVHLVPTQGSLVYYYFSNLSRLDLPGNLIMSAASANYIPHDFSGTPQWFATAFTPQGTDDQIAKEVAQAGFKAFDIQKVTIDGKPSIRMLYLRGYYNNYLDIAYVIYNSTLNNNPNIFIAMSIDYVKSATDFSDVTDAEIRAMIDKLKDGTLSEQSMRRYNQFEAMIKTIQFSQ